ncbi:MAG: hypothetical protein ACOY5Y_08210 [Pseudomonadota bacterium]
MRYERTMFSEPDTLTPSRETRAASIAVAPLASTGLSPDQARLAWAFLDEVIGELARFPSIEVLAGHTSFALSAEELQPDRLAERFGVTHLLDAGVRPGDGALQVRAALVETASGRHVWSHACEAPLKDLDTASGEIAATIANQLSARIDRTRLAQARARPIAKLEAYDLWLRGREVLRQGSPESDAEAREYFERALTIDPTYARAYAGLSLSHFNDWSCQRWTHWEEGERLAYEYARRAVELDDTDHLSHAVLGRIEIYRRNHSKGRWHIERTVALSPNNADALMQTSLWWSYLGDDDRAQAQVDKAFRLNPLHEPWYFIYAFLVAFLARRLEAAIALAEAAPPNVIVDQAAFMASTYAHLGRLEDARRSHEMFVEVFREKITGGREPRPGEPLDYLLHVNPFTRRADADFLVEGLRAAGLTGTPSGGVYRHEDGADVAQFKRSGQLWELEFSGRRAIVADMKGCSDLAALLANPRARLHCMDLAGRLAEGDAGAAMDARARAECQRRIQDLQAEIAEAERDNDFARTERMSAELDALIDQLTAAMGLGGRGRKLGDPAEKARTAVTWRIRSAIKKIAQAHPPLGRHLQASIRTGAFCAYEPETPIRWTAG